MLTSPTSHCDFTYGSPEQSDIDDDKALAFQSHNWKVYRACAQEFHTTGTVKSGQGNSGFQKRRVHMSLILLALVFFASMATGTTPLALLSISLTSEIDSLAIKLAKQAVDVVIIHLQQLTAPCPYMCDQIHQMFAAGILSSHLEGGVESPGVQATLAYQYEILRLASDAHLLYYYMSTEFDADIGYEVRNGTILMWNRTDSRVLAPAAGAPAPLANSTGLPADMAWRALGKGKFDSSQLIDFQEHYEPRTRGWYKTAKAGGRDWHGWSEPYGFYDGETLGVTASRPLYNVTDDFFGVAACDITLEGVVLYLKSEELRLSPNMRHIVLETNGGIIGSNIPNIVISQKDDSGEFTRILASDPRQPKELLSIIHYLQRGQEGFANITTNGEVVSWDGYYYYATLLQDDYHLQWLYIMYAPTSDFLSDATGTTRLSISLCVAMVVIITLMALMSAWHFSRLMSLLAENMRYATSLSLDSIQTTQAGSHVKEINDIYVEFNKLVNALKSFQKYLPQSQVGFLLKSNLEAHVAAIQQEITVMFLDIENFTSTVEILSEVEMLEFYSDIMTMLTHKVLQAEGTLDKYIGDAVMAFWNMPQLVVHHATKAVETALACREAIPQLVAKGWEVEFRIGLNTGVCQVGNFGSRNRLNYTAIGDNVNVASRLESLCKAYGCRILVAESTYNRLETGKFSTRLVDKVAVKGKDAVTIIYQVFGYRCDASEEMKANCKDYEEAFGLYAQGSYDIALRVWRRCAARGDPTAQMMAERLEKCRPATNAVWKWDTK